MSMGDPALDSLPAPSWRHDDPVAHTVVERDLLNLDQTMAGPMRNPHLVGIASAMFLTPPEIEALVAMDDASVRWDHLGAERIWHAFLQANGAFYHFDLARLHDEDGPTVRLLRSGDEIPVVTCDRSTRKLTMVLPIAIHGSDSAFIQFPQVDRQVLLEPGLLVISPSFVHARMATDKATVVEALVTFAVGPSFR